MNHDAVMETVASQTWLSELYAQNAPDAVLLAEYPCSNSDQTRFRNESKFIIHDPFPAPPPELLKSLGPHHLMYGWGQELTVTSQLPPPEVLLDHWSRLLGASARANWVDFDSLKPDQDLIVLFPHQSLSPTQQLVDPEVNYRLHSKEVIEQIECSQAEVYSSPRFPCIAKLTHGYAGLSNYMLADQQEFDSLQVMLQERWPNAKLVYNSIIQDICGDFGLQFFLNRDGTTVWLGFTEQKFDANGRWCGGWFSASDQEKLKDECRSILNATATYLSSQGYFGVVGIDVLINRNGEKFLVDVNPRLTGITPFLMASLRYNQQGLSSGIYRASCRFRGSLESLVSKAESYSDARVAILSAYENPDGNQVVAHVSVSAESHSRCEAIFDQLLVE